MCFHIGLKPVNNRCSVNGPRLQSIVTGFLLTARKVGILVLEQSETNRHPLEEQEERIRKTGVLGRSSLMHNLFDYLARCAET